MPTATEDPDEDFDEDDDSVEADDVRKELSDKLNYARRRKI